MISLRCQAPDADRILFLHRLPERRIDPGLVLCHRRHQVFRHVGSSRKHLHCCLHANGDHGAMSVVVAVAPSPLITPRWPVGIQETIASTPGCVIEGSHRLNYRLAAIGQTQLAGIRHGYRASAEFPAAGKDQEPGRAAPIVPALVVAGWAWPWVYTWRDTASAGKGARWLSNRGSVHATNTPTSWLEYPLDSRHGDISGSNRGC